MSPPRLELASLGPAGALLAAVREAFAGPAWLVGGAVRDALLGRAVVDLDLALPGGSLPAARTVAARLGGAFVPLSAPHGVARVVVRAEEAEGGPATRIDFADFRADGLEADLRGRDVTVNALAVPLGPLVEGGAAVIDPTGGLGDLAARRLRACAATAFADDPIRILRLLREGHELAFGIEADTAHLARAAVPGLGAVAAERVRDELTRLLRLARSAAVLRDADAWDVLLALAPETGPMRAATQSAPHRFTVWEHSLRALEAGEALLADLGLLGAHQARVARHLVEPLGGELTRREVVKVAILLHDVGKPETRSVDPDGRVRFNGHDRRGAELAAGVAVRLRWPRRAVEVLERLVRQHLRPMHLGMLEAISRRTRYRFFRDLGDEVPDLVCLTIADAAGTDGRAPAGVYRGATRALLDSLLAGQVAAAREAASPPLLRGGDVMALFGLAPGPEVGRLLGAVREAQALGLVQDREAALAWLRQRRAAADPD